MEHGWTNTPLEENMRDLAFGAQVSGGGNSALTVQCNAELTVVLRHKGEMTESPIFP